MGFVRSSDLADRPIWPIAPIWPTRKN